MEYQERKCPKCGASLENRNGEYYCTHCKKTWENTTLMRTQEMIEESLKKTIRGEVSAALIEQRMADCYKYLTEIYIALSPLNENKPVTQTSLVLRYAQKIMDLNPENSLLHNRAKFYCLATKNKWTELNDFLASLRFNTHEKWVVEEIIKYLENTNNAKWALGAQALITNTYADNDPERDRYRQRLTEAEALVDDGTFDPAVNRNVFIAYSSKDIDKAMELLEKLEERDIDCFFALRNLSNVGAEYEKDLMTALEHCKVFVFVSTKNSRSRNCDAYNIELKRVWEMDEKRNNVRNDYEHLPIQYKKPRVEWLLDEYRGTRYDKEVATFFKGFTRHADIDHVIDCIEDLRDRPTYTMGEEALRAFQKMETTFTETREEVLTRAEFEKLIEERDRKSKTADEAAWKEAVEAARKEGAEAARREMEEKARIREQQIARERAQEQARREAEEKARLREQQIARERAEERARLQEQERARKNAEEWYNTGVRYYNEQNYIEAVYWYRKAAEQGHTEAQNNLGVCYEYGKGVEQDYEEAAKWYKKAAEQGHTEAQNNLGVCYEYGKGVEQDYEEAAKWYKKAAEQGNANAQTNLGFFYENGHGVAQSYQEAVKWYQKAAKQGSVVAKEKHEKLLKKAQREKEAALKVQAEEWFQKGFNYYIKQYYEGAVNWWKKAAEQGHVTAQCNLGECYAHGKGVEQSDTEAVKWYQKAAEQGSSTAQFNLGECYEHGRGIEQNDTEAMKWYQKVAKWDPIAKARYEKLLKKTQKEKEATPIEPAKSEKTFAELMEELRESFGLVKEEATQKGTKEEAAQKRAEEQARKEAEERARLQEQERARKNAEEWYNTGVRYYNEQNYIEAVKWYRKAAEQGHSEAQTNLGFCYDQGHGVAQSYSEAVYWYQKAAEQGEKYAQNNLGICYENGFGVTKNYAEAAKWYKKAVDNGYSEASTYYQNVLHKIQESKNANTSQIAEEWYQKGENYQYGRGVEQSYEEAAKWYQKAAEQGHAKAQFNLGRLYYGGFGVQEDGVESLKWTTKAAENGLVIAQELMGDYYYEGFAGSIHYDVKSYYYDENRPWLLEKDYTEAAKWYRKAAEQGSSYAQERLEMLNSQQYNNSNNYDENFEDEEMPVQKKRGLFGWFKKR